MVSSGDVNAEREAGLNSWILGKIRPVRSTKEYLCGADLTLKKGLCGNFPLKDSRSLSEGGEAAVLVGRRRSALGPRMGRLRCDGAFK